MKIEIDRRAPLIVLPVNLVGKSANYIVNMGLDKAKKVGTRASLLYI